MKTSILMLLAVLIATPSFAKGNGPCKQIIQSCEAGGYTKGGQGQKRLWKNCVKPLKSGQTVTGVSVEPSVVQACVAKKSHNHADVGVPVSKQ